MELFLICLLVTIIIFVCTWFIAVKIDNYSIVDFVWSYSFFAHALLFSFLSDGWLIRKIVFVVAVGFWSLRLGTYLLIRISKHHPHEDTRYIKLRTDYGATLKLRFLLFFLYQAFSVSLLTIPFVFIVDSKESGFSVVEILGFAILFVSVLGEALADSQMSKFKSLAGNKGKTCNIGLWKYSRHPNYFFESNVWWGVFLISLGISLAHWWMIYVPLTMLFVLLKVTGVPPSEEQSLKNRPDTYPEYQRKTSKFVPWFPKE